jgi:uncharacterized SAM-binding protein YcdF (DUF218 family)
MLSRNESQSTHRRKKGQFVVMCLFVAVLLTLCVWLTPLALTATARALVRADPISKADLAIALGGDPRCWREKQAAAIYHQGLVPRLVVSGIPYGEHINSGDAARRYLVSLGVPESDVLVLKEEWNTRIEARDLSALMHQRGWKSAIVVTSPYHSRRALYTMCREAPDLEFRSAPAFGPRPGWQPEMWWTRRGDTWLTIRELFSWANTVAGGLK